MADFGLISLLKFDFKVEIRKKLLYNPKTATNMALKNPKVANCLQHMFSTAIICETREKAVKIMKKTAKNYENL